MKIANVAGRSALIIDGGVLDIQKASNDQFPADPQLVYENWDELVKWAGQQRSADAALDDSLLDAVVPKPRQIFALGLNYTEHARESGHESAKPAPVFTKFPSCLAGPIGDLVLPSDFVDWEVELVVVMARTAFQVQAVDSWSYVAGLTVGQDFSERKVQSEGAVPQFSLGKSYPGFGPIGPYVVTPDEVRDPEDLELSTVINGVDMQRGRTSQMLFGVPETIERLSHVCPLWPGDLLFMGTPGGVGNGRDPKVFLHRGDVVVSAIEDVGAMRHTCVTTELSTPGKTI